MVLRLSAIAGLWLFSRFLLAHAGYGSTMDVGFEDGADTGKSTEWLRGEKLCTFRGKYHLAWSVPMTDPSYYMPSAQIHAFMMYAPFLALYEKRGMLVQGGFLLLTGPVMAAANRDGRGDINPGFAGQGIGMIKAVRPAKEIFDELAYGAEQALSRTTNLLR